MSKFGPKELNYNELNFKQQLQWDFLHWRNFEKFESNEEQSDINVMYFVNGTTPIMEDFSKITMEYINKQIRI